jgi:putative SOS response-associated peptidase YedK
MVKRVAFFASKQEVENFFDISADSAQLFEPHYNLTVGHHIPVVTHGKDGMEISRIRWGSQEGNTTAELEEVDDLIKKGATPCAVPLSGFYVWKAKREKDHPFFVRMLNGPLMATGGLIFYGDRPHMKIITGESNVLVQPMSERMPLILDRNTALHWIQNKDGGIDMLTSSAKKVLLTDLSVMRVSKKVNDPKNNDPKLIQPIPK